MISTFRRAAFVALALAQLARGQAVAAQVSTGPYLDGVSLTARAVSQAGGYFEYTFRLTNGATSRAAVGFLALDLSAPPGTGRQWLPPTGPARHAEPAPGTVALRDHVPVGAVSPARWQASLGVDPQLEWWGSANGLMDVDTIAPGQSLEGFGVRSTYLPGIREFSTEPTWQSCCSRPKPDSEDGEHPRPSEFRAVGRTVGPLRSPADVANPARALALIRSDLAASCGELSWIADGPEGGICTSLRAKLTAAAAAVEAGNASEAANQLGALLNELDALRGRQVSENAYWLLRTNAQYVRDRLTG